MLSEQTILNLQKIIEEEYNQKLSLEDTKILADFLIKSSSILLNMYNQQTKDQRCKGPP